MKLIKFIALAFILNVICSCEDSKTYNEMSICGVGRISKFDYEGHTYLIRNKPVNGYIGYGGMCHDENCKCKTN